MGRLWAVLLALMVGSCGSASNVEYLRLPNTAGQVAIEAPAGEFIVPYLGASEEKRLVVEVAFQKLDSSSMWAPMVAAGFTTLDKAVQVKAFVAHETKGGGNLHAGYQVIQDGRIKKRVTLIEGLPLSEKVVLQIQRGEGNTAYVRVGGREARLKVPGRMYRPVILVSSASTSLRWHVD